ncbi:YdbH domain-containing protein [Sphingomonas lenta]|uniref:Uncharacterized protein n=1 Tax=Sphingomonas lenta TaxID=1141887 RepID=A0A2A2SJE3_9SPHN|nr:YdbH domain-containing protein [Sphingomonas lenta]PAX09404.1 hypothetical protein CKY28_01215 [Sphingomonas lenta]
MTEESDGSPARPARRRLRVALTVLSALVVLLAGSWLLRIPIAGRAIDRELASAGVPARYNVETLELGRQRLTDVVIGDPERPDLVADWIETGTRLSWSGATVTAVRAGHVRLRGRLVDGRVSLGAIDRLLPPPSGKPFALPRLFLDVADARIRLETPMGVVGLRLSGRGRLDDGFDGRLAAVSRRVEAGGCVALGVAAATRVSVSDTAPTVDGPVRAARLVCEGGSAEAVRTDARVAFTPALDGWRGSARLATGAIAAEVARAASASGSVSFDGDARATAGRAELALAGLASEPATARRLALRGEYRIGDGVAFDGRVRGEGVAASGVRLDADALAGTPLEPIARQVAAAAAQAGRAFAVDMGLTVDTREGLAIEVAELAARSASGARVRLDGGEGVSWSRAGLLVDGTALVSGGGLPGMRVSLDQAAPGAPIGGLARVAAYEAGGARLALTPVSFTAAGGGATRIATTATLSGPIGDGRVDGLTMPLNLVWDGGNRLAINPGCTPASLDRLRVAGLTLAPTRLRLCATEGTLMRVADGRVTGGASIVAPRIAGRLGATPVELAASGGEVSLAGRGFTLRDVAARLGSPGRVTRIDVGRLQGRISGGAVAGTFAGTGGRIANVPLLLSDAAGEWRLAGGVLTLGGATTVTDAEQRRFEPLLSPDVAFRLADNRIWMTGTLVEPTTRTEVADVRIAHDLPSGRGEALLDVPGVTFTERLQPEALTPLTFGVIADVRGTVRGEGRIAWSPQAVTSSGEFRTDDTDLAAAFGPVEGLATTIRFTDLLQLRSAPGQVATVRSINPGVRVTDGVIRYQTLPETRVQVEGGRWPFAGGELRLEPTLLDFSQPVPKRLTFRVTAMEAAQFLQQFEFENINATGVFDGVLPMVFDERSGRVEGGSLVVRPGGGTLAYVGELTQRELGFWGDLAFQALKSIRYQNLTIGVNGPLAGEMVTDVRFAGVSQGEGAKSNFIVRRLQRLPFVFNIRIKAPFRSLIDSAASFYDPKRLIQRNLPALLMEQNKRAAPPQPQVQPPASRKMP